MKQYVSLDQLNGLEEKEQKTLSSWWTPEYGDLFHDPKYGIVYYNGSSPCRRKVSENDFLPVLSIGQMIEFLEEKGVVVDITRVWKANKIENICDTLWEAVKKVLEENA